VLIFDTGLLACDNAICSRRECILEDKDLVLFAAIKRPASSEIQRITNVKNASKHKKKKELVHQPDYYPHG